MSHNTSIAAGVAKNHFGEVLDAAQSEPVIIEKHGRPVAVLLSMHEYARLEGLEDARWAEQAKPLLKNKTRTFLGVKKTTDYINRVLHAQDKSFRKGA